MRFGCNVSLLSGRQLAIGLDCCAVVRLVEAQLDNAAGRQALFFGLL